MGDPLQLSFMACGEEIPLVLSEEYDDVVRNEPDAMGQLSATVHGDGTLSFGGALRSQATRDQVSRFVAWATTAIKQLVDNPDPEANGWFPSQGGDGEWYMTAVVREMPSLD